MIAEGRPQVVTFVNSSTYDDDIIPFLSFLEKERQRAKREGAIYNVTVCECDLLYAIIRKIE